MLRTVVLAPVPCVHLESASTVPALSDVVAFGSSQEGVPNLPIGVPVFIYASQPPHSLFKLGTVSWTGTLSAIVPAVRSGSRSGQHPDPLRRPPAAEATDKPCLFFWEVLGLTPLDPVRRLDEFKAKAFIGEAPRWPVVAELDC
jgi:hypothetical protein